MPACQPLKGEGPPRHCQPHSDHNQIPAADVLPTAARHTLLHLRMQLSQFWSLSAEKRGSRLFQAAVQGAARELRMLVTAGNDTEMGGGRLLWRGTALHFAAREGHVEGARCLLECSGGRQEQLSR